MISFRFHVVSITAVFLAIAIGIVVGSTYVDGAVVDGLRSQIEGVSEDLDQRREDNDRLEAALEQDRAYIAESMDFAVTSRLTDVPLLVLATRGIDEGPVEEIVRLARRAGANVPGVVWVEGRLGLEADDDRTQLAEVLGASSSAGQARLQEDAVDAILASVASPEAPPAVDDLIAAGFLTLDDLGDSSVPLSDLLGSGARVALVMGTRTLPELADVTPLLAGAAIDNGLTTVVGDEYVAAPEAAPRGEALLETVGSDVTEVASVVDDAELPQGQVAMVLALDSLDNGVVGHYGYGSGADSVLPSWSPP